MQIWSAEIKELESLYTSIKGEFPKLEKELEQLVKFDDANVILIYSRRCLEVIISDLCINELKRPRKTEPLKGIIDKLGHEEKVPSHIIASMEGLNSLSTFGAHPKDFDPEQVRPILLNLATIIKWYVKYKDTQTISKATREEAKYESKEPVDTREGIHKPKKKLIFLLSGLLVVMAIVVALFVFNIIGGGKQTKELEKSIAVLPFVNLSSDEEQIWFSDGITDIIISQLSKISGLRVLGRTSTLRYSEEQKSIGEIGKELGVNFIIEGTVQRQENKMRISVQLIRVLNEGHLWSDIYDREWIDIFDVQSEIAQRIAEELKTVLTPEEKEQVEKKQTENPEAYNLYLQGRFFWGKRTKEGLKKSIEFFNKAIVSDPGYALAYAGLADAYYIQAWWRYIHPDEGFARAKETALKALELDKNLAEAHTVLGSLYTYNERKWEEAKKELELAIELDPNFVTAHHYYSELLIILEKLDEAREQINIALQIDPYLPVLHVVSARCYNQEGMPLKSLDEYEIALELDPEYGNGVLHWSKSIIYIRQQEENKAVEEMHKALQMDTTMVIKATIVKEVFNKSGMKGLLTWIIDLEIQKEKPNYILLSKFYTFLDKKEEAIKSLENAMDAYYPNLLWNITCPDYENLHSEPGFQALIRKMGLSEYAKKE